MCIHTGRPTSGKVPIIFSTYNICNGRNSGLEAALTGMAQANMDLGILQETKITDGIYTRGSAGRWRGGGWLVIYFMANYVKNKEQVGIWSRG